MKDTQIIGDDVYYCGELVAKLTPCKNRTLQGNFIDAFETDEKDYKDKYLSLVDALPGTSNLDDIENLLNQIKRTPNNKHILAIIESELHSLRNSFDYMYSEVE